MSCFLSPLKSICWPFITETVWLLFFINSWPYFAFINFQIKVRSTSMRFFFISIILPPPCMFERWNRKKAPKKVFNPVRLLGCCQVGCLLVCLCVSVCVCVCVCVFFTKTAHRFSLVDVFSANTVWAHLWHLSRKLCLNFIFFNFVLSNMTEYWPNVPLSIYLSIICKHFEFFILLF